MSERFIHRFEPALEGAGDGTLLLLHGTGGNENDLLPLGRAIAPNAALLSPRGPVLEHGMARFFRPHALAELVLWPAARYRFDPAGVVALGFSNGANIAAAVMLLRPEILAGAVLLRAMVPFVPEKLPDLSGRRVLVAAGKTDPVVAPRASEELAELLRGAGAEVTLHWSQGGHVLERSDLAAAAAWWQAKVPK